MIPGDAGMGWLFAMIVASAIGAGFFIYGIKQKDIMSTLLGIILSVLPFIVHGTWPMMTFTFVFVGGFFYLRKRF